MPTLNGQISFTVKFDLTGTPTLKLQASTTIPGIDKPNLTGYFAITQPDGIQRVGNYTTPDVAWSGSAYPEFSIPLRTASDGTYQRGNYIITFFANCAGYTPGEITRNWTASFVPVAETLTQLFDLYTPSLAYRNDTVYTNGDYAIISQTESWAATCAAGAITPSTSANFDLAVGGNYYDCIFSITHNKTVTYQNNTITWFSIVQDWDAAITDAAYIPAAMTVLLGYLDDLKAVRDANSCDDKIDETYEAAAVLYTHIRNKICAQVLDNLKSYFDEFYRLTHNYQNPVYVNTNSIIPPYDFTTGCSGSGGGATTLSVSLRPTPGVSSFTVGAAAGKTIRTATRSGISKGITASATTDPEYLQVVANVVTLPTGDIVASVTLPDLSVVGELFTFTYN